MLQTGNILAKVKRGEIVESFHQGHIVVVNNKGKTIFSVGDPNFFTYIRSAAKPLQAITVIESGAVEKFSITNEEIALMCASHSGEDVHVSVGKGLLKKLGLTEEFLACGIHAPKDKESAKKLLNRCEEPGVLHNNCSGKHLGMLTLSLHRNYSLQDYTERSHPVQQEMLKTIAKYCHLTPEEFEIGIDGCGVPVFAMPLKNMARAYAEIAAKSATEPNCKRVVKSMLEFPHLVAGTNRLCSDLIRETKGKVIGKVGTEAIYCIALLKEQLGIAIKLNDGSPRALGPIVIELLQQLGVLSEEEIQGLENWQKRILRNHRGETIGEITASFKMSQDE